MFTDESAHRATRLLDHTDREVGRGGRIRCPYHGRAYDTDGSCPGTPLFEGPAVPAFDTSGAMGFDRADVGLLPVAVDTWDLVNPQDLEIVERVQQGIENPAHPGGRMCYRFEEPPHRFQNMVIDRMVGLDRVPAGDDE